MNLATSVTSGWAKRPTRKSWKRRANPEEVIITHDLDYGTLLAFSGRSSPSVIIIRLTDMRSNQVSQKILAIWDQIREHLESGAIITLSSYVFRIRRLPISEQRQV